MADINNGHIGPNNQQQKNEMKRVFLDFFFFFVCVCVAEIKELMKENTLATMSSNFMINFLRTGVTNDYLKNLNQLKLKIAC